MKHACSGKKTRLLRVELLEARQLLAATGVNASGTSDPGAWYELPAFTAEPNANEQEMLELINRMRSDPAAELKRLVPVCDPEAEGGPWLTYGTTPQWNGEFFTAMAPEILQNCQDRYPALNADTLRSFLSQWNNLSSAAPLAFNTSLLSVARTFTDYLMTHGSEFVGDFVHNKKLENDLGGQFYSFGENVYSTPQVASSGLSPMEFFHAAFAIDWGNSSAEHRANIMNAGFSEIGVAVKRTSDGKYYSVVDFGTSTTGARTDGAYLLGVVYGDANKNGIYNAQEGIDNVKLFIRNLDLDTENTVEITNMSSGGYQIFLQNGRYSITATGAEDFPGPVTKLVSINGSNKKVDFLTSDFSLEAPQVDLGGGIYYDYGIVVTCAEESPSVSPITTIKITDRDSPFLSEAKVSLLNRPNGNAENIVFSGDLPASVSAVNDFNQGTLTLQGQASVATYTTILSTLSWSFNGSNLSPGESMSYEDRLMAVEVFDGVNWSQARIVTLKVDPIDPVMSIASTKAYEGDNGITYMEFEAVLDTPAKTSCSCSISPQAQPDLSDLFTDDYFVEDRVNVAFEPGQSRQTFQIGVHSNYAAQKNKKTVETNTVYRLEDDLYFVLDVADCNGLAWRGNEVRGTIIDDDTPSFVISDTHWDFVPRLNFKTEYGTQRFMYAVTASNSGLMTWSADSDVPDGFTISVYQSEYSQTPLAGDGVISETTATGKKLQWAVSQGNKYIVKVEKLAGSAATYIANQKYAFLRVETGNVIMVDPLLPVNNEPKVQVEWNENGIDVDVNGRLWTLGADDPFTVKSDNPDIALELHFSGNTGSFASDGNMGGFAPEESTQYGWFEGFTEILVTGSNMFETLYFEGTEGDDKLVFESDSGSGYFITNAGTSRELTYRFTKVTNIVFTGGNGGEDTAELHDSRYNDFADVSETSVTLHGGGYSVSAVDFQNVQVLFDNGGSDTVTLENQKEDITAMLWPQTLNVTGQTSRSKTPEGTEVPFNLEVKYFDHFIGTPKSVLDMLYVLSGNNKSIRYNTGIGWFSSHDPVTGHTASARNFRQIVFAGMNNTREGVVTVHADEGAELVTDPTTKVVTLEKEIPSDTGTPFVWKLRLPSNYILYPGASSPEDPVTENTTTADLSASSPATANALPEAVILPEESIEEILPLLTGSCRESAVSALYDDNDLDSVSSFDWELGILLDIDINNNKNRRRIFL